MDVLTYISYATYDIRYIFINTKTYFLFFKSSKRFIKSAKSMSSLVDGLFGGKSVSDGTAGKSGSWKSFIGIFDRGCGFGF